MGHVELVILCGLQASGKSTFRRERFPQHVVVSKDLLRNNRRPERRQRHLIAEALSVGQSVVVDNTNPAPEDRAPLVEIGRRLGARVLGFYFGADFEVSVARNARRSGRELVPLVGLVDVARRLRVPRAEEGFDELWAVRARGGQFELMPMTLATAWCSVGEDARVQAGRVLLVDAANVVGSRPTGWWRDRAKASADFIERVRRATAASKLPQPVIVVLEGEARDGTEEGVSGGVEVVHAPGQGDHTLVALATAAIGAEPVVLVSADRALGDRCRRVGVEVVGPSWLLDRIS